jgi:hypothetical protein
MPIARQQILSEATVEQQQWKKLCFLYGLCREVTSGTRLGLSQFCEENT